MNEYALAPLSIKMIGSVWRKRRRPINCNRNENNLIATLAQH